MNRRIPVLVMIIGLVVAALVFDSTREAAVVETADDEIDAGEFPITPDPASLSSTWFCAGGTADDEAFADHVVTILNPNERATEITLTAFAGEIAPPAVEVDPESLDDDPDATTTTTTTAAPAEGGTSGDTTTTTEPATPPAVRQIELGPRSRTQVVLRELVQAPIASALVEAPTGGIVVEHEVSSVHGYDAKPCATAAAPTWHFAFGSTRVDARELLVLFNPFPDDAIVDGRFSTEDGVRQPVRFDGLVVPGRSTLAVDLGDDVTRREQVAGTISARAGRIVVDRIVRFDGEGGVRGLTVQTGVPEPQLTWIYPDGYTAETVRETYVVYNPTESLAEVEIEILPERPDENGIPEPVDLSLPPGSHQVVDLTADGRVPPEVAHAAIVRAANDVPIVAERVLYSDRESRRGITVTTGSPVEAERWSFAAGRADAATDEWLVLVNLDPQIIAEVDITAVAGGQEVPIADLQDLTIEASGRLAVRLGEKIQRDDLAVVVTSNEPIVVERGIYRVGEDQRGMSMAVGVPSLDGLRLPADPLDAQVDADLGEGEDPLAPDGEDDDVPQAPDDVELPEPDETIVIDDPDAEATTPSSSTTAPSTTASTTAPPSSTTAPPG